MSLTDTKVVTTSPPAKRRPPRAGLGRPKGYPNKTTRTLKEAILLAAEAVGEDGKGKAGLVGYLMRLADKEPASFASLLGKVLPMQITGGDGEPLGISVVFQQPPKAPD